MPVINEDGKNLNLYLSNIEVENMLDRFNSSVEGATELFTFSSAHIFQENLIYGFEEANLNMFICRERIEMAKIAFAIVYAHKK